MYIYLKAYKWYLLSLGELGKIGYILISKEKTDKLSLLNECYPFPKHKNPIAIFIAILNP